MTYQFRWRGHCCQTGKPCCSVHYECVVFTEAVRNHQCRCVVSKQSHPMFPYYLTANYFHPCLTRAMMYHISVYYKLLSCVCVCLSVCVRVCVCVSVCMYAHMCECACLSCTDTFAACTYTHICTYTYAHILFIHAMYCISQNFGNRTF